MHPFRKPLDESYRTRLINEALAFCVGYENGTLSLTEISRRLTRISHDLGVENEPDFLLIRGIESETDKFPLGPHRDIWGADVLQRFDTEREAIEASYAQEASAAIRRIHEMLN